jgi:hypothetical protein
MDRRVFVSGVALAPLPHRSPPRRNTTVAVAEDRRGDPVMAESGEAHEWHRIICASVRERLEKRVLQAVAVELL